MNEVFYVSVTSEGADGATELEYEVMSVQEREQGDACHTLKALYRTRGEAIDHVKLLRAQRAAANAEAGRGK